MDIFTHRRIGLIGVIFITFCIFTSPLHSSELQPEESNFLKIDRRIFNTVYSDHEQMHFTISWSGGIKIGDLLIEVKRNSEKETLEIYARVTDYGLFKLIYPVDDTFRTIIEGAHALPVTYGVHQKEGWGSETKRLTVYDQQGLKVSYKKNNQAVQSFNIDGPVYNEFSSFYISRVFQYKEGEKIIVPTFVDKKRHLVEVKYLGTEQQQSIFGLVQTKKIMPVMNFKGLYDKDGDTVYWLTDDECRVPVLINSKIAVGSLTARLTSYTNQNCSVDYTLTSSHN